MKFSPRKSLYEMTCSQALSIFEEKIKKAHAIKDAGGFVNIEALSFLEKMRKELFKTVQEDPNSPFRFGGIS